MSSELEHHDWLELIDVARGKIAFDVLLSNAHIIDVVTGEIRLADIGIYKQRIASVHAQGSRTDALEIHDLSGTFICPGFIDTHVHLESTHLSARAYAQIVLPQGTTSVLWDPHELANVEGVHGVRYAIDSSRGVDLRIHIAAPSCVPSAPGLEMSGADIGAPEMQTMLRWPEVIGVAELMDMGGILDHSQKMQGIMSVGRASGKILDGHARNLTGPDLQAYVAAGVQTDHELVDAQDAIAKLRAGLRIQLRISHAHIFPDLVQELLKLPHLGCQISLCTDDLPPDIILEQGGIVANIRKLIECGLAPVDAIRLATFNASLGLGLQDQGLIAAGRLADLVVLEDLNTVAIKSVYFGGQLVSKQQTAIADNKLQDPNPLPIPELIPSDFEISTPETQQGTVVLRTIKGVRYTEWGQQSLPIVDGQVQIPAKFTRLAIKHRHSQHSRPVQLALLEDWGQFSGAIASTYAHDSHNLVIIGSDPSDMAVAGNTLRASGGGWAVVKNGQVLAQVDMPLFGMLADTEPELLAKDFAQVRQASAMVAQWDPPLRTLKNIEGISLACNKGPHLTDLGLTDGTEKTIVPMVISIL